jgi:hypothetical protein
MTGTSRHLVSASGLGRAMVCPASVVLPKDRRLAGEAADKGHAIHGFLEQAGSLGRDDALANVPEEYRAICEAIDLSDVPVSAVKFAAEVALAWDVATSTAREIGRGIGRYYGPTSRTEIVGTADVIGLSTDGTRVYVWDYKTGRTELVRAARNWQLRFLAFTACRLWGAVDAIVGLIHVPAYRVDGEDDEVEELTPTYDSAYLDAWEIDAVEGELAAAVESWLQAADDAAAGRPPRAVKGRHCDYCDAMPRCPAATAMIRAFSSGTAADELIPVSPEAAAAAWMTIEALEAVIKPAKAALYSYAAREPIELPYGVIVGAVTERGKPTYDAKIVRQVLASLHGRDVADAACDFSTTKTAIERAISAHAKATGVKAAPLKRAALKAIAEAGGEKRELKTKIKPHVPASLAREEIRALEMAMSDGTK